MTGEEVQELRTASLRTLARVSTLLRAAEIDASMKACGWTPEFARFLAREMEDCQSKLEAGWLPGHNYGGQWIRSVMERIIAPKGGGVDQLNRAVEQAGDVVNRLGRANESN
jgi:hypothetical protein